MRFRFGSVLVFLLLGTGASHAQLPGVPAAAPSPSPSPEAAASSPAQPAPEGLTDDTPRGALTRFLNAARDTDYAEAARYLDLSRIPESDRDTRGPDLARRLKVVFDRTIWFDLDAASDQPQGATDDGLPAGVDRVGQIDQAGQRVAVLMHRVPAPDGTEVWKFSPSLVARVPSLYAVFGYGWLGDHVPGSLHRMTFLNVELWQLAGLVLLGLLAWPLSRLAAAVILRVAKALAARTSTDVDDQIIAAVRRPLRWAVWLAIFAAGVPALDLPVKAEQWLGKGMGALAFVIVILAFAGAADTFAHALRKRFVREGQPSGAGMVSVANRIVKVMLVFFAATGLLKIYGFDVTTVLAGLGIGGVAVALAAQKTIENLFGGATVMADKPVRVGDFCKFGDKMGWVDDIGLRSTRVRTLDMTMLTVPNGQFANEQIENFAGRQSMRFLTVVNLRYETTPDQMRAVLANLRKLFIGHPKVGPEMLRVRFVGLGSASLDIEINSYIHTGDVAEFYAIREDLLLRIMDIVKEAGSDFAFPSQTIYMGRDGGLDDAKVRRAAERVEELRRAGQLPFPDFSKPEIDAMTDRLDWPPEGSVVRPPAT